MVFLYFILNHNTQIILLIILSMTYLQFNITSVHFFNNFLILNLTLGNMYALISNLFKIIKYVLCSALDIVDFVIDYL